MSAALSAQNPEASCARVPILAALVYPQDKYPALAFEALVASCRRRGLSLAGVLQHLVDTVPNRRCDVVLEDLATGHRTSIFEYRGDGASGCRLDEAALAEAAARVEASLEDEPDLLVLNKFGKAECSGGGLLDLVASVWTARFQSSSGCQEAIWRRGGVLLERLGLSCPEPTPKSSDLLRAYRNARSLLRDCLRLGTRNGGGPSAAG